MKYDEKVLTQQYQEAKKRGDQVGMREAMISLLQPEAEMVLELARNDMTTKNGYGTIMRACGAMKEWGPLMLEACKRAGYDHETAGQVAEIMGYR